MLKDCKLNDFFQLCIGLSSVRFVIKVVRGSPASAMGFR